MRWVLGSLTLILSFGGSLFLLENALGTQRDLPLACLPGPLPREAALYSNGALEIPLCRRARVRMVLEGTLAQGRGPWAMVVEGRRVLWQGEVRGRREVRVEATGEGTLVLAFTNDLYQPPEDRNLFLRELTVEPR
ncbi:MAG: hypothetical protein ACO2OU_08050 [Thermus aquaticus]|uniref:hypothetical protein n=1 Tax=Thermus aquaticus TaxID=271 RepID=UPI003BFD9309